MNRIAFNGESSQSFGIYVSGEGTFNSPELDTISYSVPGKNGDIIISNNRYKNITVTYPAFIRSNFKQNSDRAREWLLSPQGYKRLSDDYHPGEFRLAKFVSPLDFTMRFLNYSGECNLTFDCKPQRFLTSGEEPITFESNSTLYNGHQFTANPLITVYGSGNGNLTIGDRTVTLTGISEYVTLDSDIQNAYKGNTNKNGSMSGEFPVLKSGNNIISFSGGITKVTIVPRWWTL